MLRLSAMLLLLWYCFSVIGFNVHTCRASGRSFVTTFVSGLSCADVHPEHSCRHHHQHNEHHHNSCCSSEGTASYSPQDCCDDDHLSLKLTGCLYDDCSRYDLIAFIATLPVQTDMTSVCLSSYSDCDDVLPPERGQIVPRDYQSHLSIWRI